MLISLIYSFCCGNGRVEEYLWSFTQDGLFGLMQASREVYRQVISSVIEGHVARLGDVPVFTDGSTIVEVSGRLFEAAKKRYYGECQ